MESEFERARFFAFCKYFKRLNPLNRHSFYRCPTSDDRSGGLGRTGMNLPFEENELEILRVLDQILCEKTIRAGLDSLAQQTELAQDPASIIAWVPVPLALYDQKLPGNIRSSWIFILRAGFTTGAERHPNSRQRMMSYRGSGDLQTRTGEYWDTNWLVSDLRAPLERRWISIPPNTWHQAVVPEENWIVISFHTVPEHELIEERPDQDNAEMTKQRRYVQE